MHRLSCMGTLQRNWWHDDKIYNGMWLHPLHGAVHGETDGGAVSHLRPHGTDVQGETTKPAKMKLKACENREFLFIIRGLLTNVFKPEDDYARTRLQCVQSLCACYEELDNWGPGSSERLADAGRRHLLLYSHLSKTRGPLV